MSTELPDLDLLLYWITERERVRTRREADAPLPWSDDPIFQRASFCNVERERDRVTAWIREHWREPHRDHADVWFLMLIARLINAPEVLGAITLPLPWDRDRFVAEMAARQAQGLSLERAAYTIHAPADGRPKYLYLANDIFSPMWAARESVRPRPGDTCKSFFNRLIRWRGIGDFYAGQVIADTKFTPSLSEASDWWTFVAPGPGSGRWLNVMHGRSPNPPLRGPAFYTEFAQVSAAMTPKLDALGLRLSAQDRQNCMCEGFKLFRARTTGQMPRRRFHPPSERKLKKKPQQSLRARGEQPGSPCAVSCVPTELPDLRRVGILAMDLETRDDGLATERGSGWPWRGGQILGVSVAYHAGDELHAHYFPMRHPGTDNLDPQAVFAWLRDLVTSDVRFVTQNGLYDWGWLRAEANIVMPPAERLEDTVALAAIIDENRWSYSLDNLCKWRGLPGKDEAGLHEAVKALGLSQQTAPQSVLWQLPARVVAPYAEADAIATLRLFENLDPVLDQEKTRDAYRLEIELLPMVHEMRRRGIRIDSGAAEQAREHLLQNRDTVFAELSEKLGVGVGLAEIGRNKWLAETFDRHGIKYPRTEKGNPSFTAGNTGWMTAHPHWLPRLIARADRLNRAAVVTIEKHILEHIVHGRLHAEIHPHRSEQGGTRTTRFSYSDSPLQQMPVHDEEIAPLIRGAFLPEEGEIWAKPDISQQEFRLVVHYAALRGLPRAAEAAERYRTDPNTDAHNMVAEMTGLARQPAKNTNFAKIYGAGVQKFAQMIGKPEAEAREIYQQYDRELPFMHRLAAQCQNEAARQGYTALYDGARRHWLWEAAYVYAKGAGPCDREEAQRRIADPQHPWFKHRLRRAETHKALNALIQGSAARHTKLWMRAVWRAGIVPLLQMHDSLDCSVASQEQAELVARLGEEAVTLQVPMRVDLAYGHSWGDAKHSWEELHGRAPAAEPVENAASIVPEPADSVGNGVNHDLEPIAGAAIEPVAAIAQVEVTAKGAGMPLTAAAEISTGKQPPPPPSKEVPPWIERDDDLPPRSGNGRTADGFDAFPEPQKSAGKILCPFHDDHNPSLEIYPGEDDPHYHCWACGAHGPLDELEIDWETALKSPTGASAGTPADDDDARNLERAHELWNKAKPIAGTLAERYLAETRGIDVGALPPNIDNALRFHPRCPFGDKRHPCLIALFRDIETGERAGIHRIALTPGAQKIERRMFGRWPRPRAIKLWPADDKLYVGEGIETVLAAATRLGMRPAWALASTSYLEKLPAISGIAELGILVDRDDHGEAAAEACCQTWKAAGRRVRRLRTKDAALNDFNDLICAKLRAAP